MIENTRLEQSTDAHVARAAVGDALPVLTVLPLPVRASPVIANVGARHLRLVITDVAGAAIAHLSQMQLLNFPDKQAGHQALPQRKPHSGRAVALWDAAEYVAAVALHGGRRRRR
jgi:hypothetical protein